jgi:hypothetical protein
MIPVEDGNTSDGSQPKVAAAWAQTSRQMAIPAWPVAQLALPALTMTAFTRPADLLEVFAADDDRRGDNAVAGEDGGGPRRVVRDGEGEVRLSAGLEAGGDGGELESGWEGGSRGGAVMNSLPTFTVSIAEELQ